jgi:hypothetical protein
MKLSAERRSRIAKLGLYTAFALLVLTTTMDLLVLAFFNSYPWWIKYCFFAVFGSLILTPVATLLSLIGLGWKRWIGLAACCANLLMIFWAATAG